MHVNTLCIPTRTVVKYSWPAFTMIIIIKTTVLCTYCSTVAYTDNRDAGERCSFTVMYLKNPFASALRRVEEKERSREKEREK